jgi:uncharacterized membrane protein (DUF2068 family)
MTTIADTGGIRLIAFFKIFKALVLCTVMAASFDLIRHEPARLITHWALTLHVDPDNHYVHALLAWLLRVDTKHLELFAVGTGLYALLFAVEGIGLWLGKTWAEYLTILSTAGLLPIEGYEVLHHTSLTKCVVLALNAAIVAYLAAHVRQKLAARRLLTQSTS